MKKVSVTLADDVEAGVRARVGSREFSLYVNDAVRRSLQADRLTEMLDEMDKTSGPVSPEVQAEVDAEDWS